MDIHQQKQIEIINKIEHQIKNGSINLSSVPPVEDFENDNRICLTTVHIPNENLKQKIQHELIEPLKKIQPGHYYYSPDSIHITIKSIKTINNPPSFSEEDVLKVRNMLDIIIPKHKKFNAYYYRLLMFPNNLALVGTTDEELDKIILEIDEELKKINLPDDKVYANKKYFFSNTTLVRFHDSPFEEFIKKVEELSKYITFDPYLIDSITLTSNNGVFKKRREVKSWRLS